MLRALVVAAAVAAVAPSATAAEQTGFAFGRAGGSIRPYTVSITVSGAVRATGPVRTRTTRVPRLELGRLNKLAATIGFPHLDKFTSCPRANPDVASTFIRVGAQTVRVHGSCIAQYQRLWRELARAARLRLSV